MGWIMSPQSSYVAIPPLVPQSVTLFGDGYCVGPNPIGLVSLYKWEIGTQRHTHRWKKYKEAQGENNCL